MKNEKINDARILKLEAYTDTLKNNKAITLVALVVTIIILLILSGISIQAITNTGLFKKAKEAKEKTDKGQAQENKSLIDYEDKIQELTDYNQTNVISRLLKKCELSEKYTKEDIINNKDGILEIILNNSDGTKIIIENSEEFKNEIIGSENDMKILKQSKNKLMKKRKIKVEENSSVVFW